MEIRTLRADEVEVRVGTMKNDGTGCSMLLYKDARCDMKVLDETFGITGWQRSHEVINGNLFCNVGVKTVNENGFCEWVWKQDVGAESAYDKQKGEASDSFKRACFNWGIGRELYTGPFIWVNLDKSETYKDDRSKYQIQRSLKFTVSDIGYNENREIIRLEIKDNKDRVRYSFGTGKVVDNPTPKATPDRVLSDKQVNRFYAMANSVGISEQVAMDTVQKKYGVLPIEMTRTQYDEVCKSLEAKKELEDIEYKNKMGYSGQEG